MTSEEREARMAALVEKRAKQTAIVGDVIQSDPENTTSAIRGGILVVTSVAADRVRGYIPRQTSGVWTNKADQQYCLHGEYYVIGHLHWEVLS